MNDKPPVSASRMASRSKRRLWPCIGAGHRPDPLPSARSVAKRSAGTQGARAADARVAGRSQLRAGTFDIAMARA